MNTIAFLDRLIAELKLNSDAELARLLGVRTGAIGNYRAKRSFFSESVAINVAKRLKLNRLYVVACVNVERNEKAGQPEVAEFWREVANELASNNPQENTQLYLV